MDNKIRDEKAFSFLAVCTGNGNEKTLKSLLVFENGEPYLSPFIFTYGFLAAIKNSRKNYIPMMLDYLIASNIKSDSEYSYLNTVFNAACEVNNLALMEDLDKRFNIIKDSLKASTNLKLRLNDTVYAEIDSQGTTYLHSCPKFNLSLPEKIMTEHSLEPLRFNARKFNRNVLDYILEKDYATNPMQLEKVILESIANQNSEASLYFVLNNKTRQTIKNSSIINLFLNEKITVTNAKKEVIAALEMLELKAELPNNNVKQNKLKL